MQSANERFQVDDDQFWSGCKDAKSPVELLISPLNSDARLKLRAVQGRLMNRDDLQGLKSLKQIESSRTDKVVQQLLKLAPPKQPRKVTKQVVKVKKQATSPLLRQRSRSGSDLKLRLPSLARITEDAASREQTTMQATPPLAAVIQRINTRHMKVSPSINFTDGIRHMLTSKITLR
jgi:hypothetical protein